MPDRRYRTLVTAIVLVALFARLPGLFWGWNFPGGWLSHHPDEFTHIANSQLMIDPGFDLGWTPTPYPKGMAAHVAAPVIASRVVRGGLSQLPPTRLELLLGGRLVSVLYGTATVLIVMLTAGALSGRRAVGLLAGAIMALGGLHVTQSHFFLADVPGLFWMLAGLHLLLLTWRRTEATSLLGWSAFCFGAAFGMKLFLAGLPSLALVVLWKRGRLVNIASTVVFFCGGFFLVNLGQYGTLDLFQTLLAGVGDPWTFDRARGALLYLLELPSVISLPVVLLAGTSLLLLVREWRRASTHRVFLEVGLVVLLPAAVQGLLVVWRLDHFPRHLVPFIPWMVMGAAWTLTRVGDTIRLRGRSPTLVYGAVLAYLAVFVVDGERYFWNDPRNAAAAWLYENVPAGTTIWWQTHTWMPEYHHRKFSPTVQPPVLVIQMMDANHYLSGIGWKNSMPTDASNVFDAESQAQIMVLQSVHRGTAGYQEVARFRERYFMPEFVLTDRWLGNRSRNYLSEVVIFMQEPVG